jgi:hypothetical protein
VPTKKVCQSKTRRAEEHNHTQQIENSASPSCSLNVRSVLLSALAIMTQGKGSTEAITDVDGAIGSARVHPLLVMTSGPGRPPGASPHRRTAADTAKALERDPAKGSWVILASNSRSTSGVT